MGRGHSRVRGPPEGVWGAVLGPSPLGPWEPRKAPVASGGTQTSLRMWRGAWAGPPRRAHPPAVTLTQSPSWLSGRRLMPEEAGTWPDGGAGGQPSGELCPLPSPPCGGGALGCPFCGPWGPCTCSCLCLPSPRGPGTAGQGVTGAGARTLLRAHLTRGPLVQHLGPHSWPHPACLPWPHAGECVCVCVLACATLGPRTECCATGWICE